MPRRRRAMVSSNSFDLGQLSSFDEAFPKLLVETKTKLKYDNNRKRKQLSECSQSAQHDVTDREYLLGRFLLSLSSSHNVVCAAERLSLRREKYFFLHKLSVWIGKKTMCSPTGKRWSTHGATYNFRNSLRVTAHHMSCSLSIDGSLLQLIRLHKSEANNFVTLVLYIFV